MVGEKAFAMVDSKVWLVVAASVAMLEKPLAASMECKAVGGWVGLSVIGSAAERAASTVVISAVVTVAPMAALTAAPMDGSQAGPMAVSMAYVTAV